MTHNAHFLAHTLFFHRFAGKNFKQLTPSTTPIIWRADDIWNCLNENSSTPLYSISDNWLSISIKSTVSFPLRIDRYVQREKEREWRKFWAGCPNWNALQLSLPRSESWYQFSRDHSHPDYSHPFFRPVRAVQYSGTVKVRTIHVTIRTDRMDWKMAYSS